jgi:hypothetical protein
MPGGGFQAQDRASPFRSASSSDDDVIDGEYTREGQDKIPKS